MPKVSRAGTMRQAALFCGARTCDVSLSEDKDGGLFFTHGDA